MTIPIYTIRLVHHRNSVFSKNEVIYDNKQTAIGLLRAELDGVTQEHAAVILLDGGNRITGLQIVGIGGLTTVSCGVSEVIRAALLGNASGLIFAHTHPSGPTAPTPSKPDRKFHARLVSAAQLFGICLVDDLILDGDGRVFSYETEALARQILREQITAGTRPQGHREGGGGPARYPLHHVQG